MNDSSVSRMHKPVLIVIAGPNGSGKTSVTSKLLHHEWMEDAIYVNPDIVAQEKFGDPQINAARIAKRVMEGGHDVPITKIIYRYYKSIANCANAAQYADKTYLYDNSIDNHAITPLYHMNFGELAKQYEENLPEWAKLILSI